MEKDIIRVGFIICDPDEYKQLKNLGIHTEDSVDT